MPRGGRWSTGASVGRTAQQAAYRAGVNKGVKSSGIDTKVSIPKESAPKKPTELAFAGATQANPGTGSPRAYSKDPGRQTALNKDGSTPEHEQQSLPALRDVYPGDVQAAAKGAAIPDFPGPVKKGSI